MNARESFIAGLFVGVAVATIAGLIARHSIKCPEVDTMPAVYVDSARATVCYLRAAGISCVPLHPITLNVNNNQTPAVAK